jgi:putative addiction module component (TIGR02574 family)
MPTLAEVEELVRSLPVADRLRLLESTWDSLDAVNVNEPMPDWQKAEIDAGLAEYRANPAAGLPLAEAMAHIRSQMTK